MPLRTMLILATLSLLTTELHAGTVMETVSRNVDDPGAKGTTIVTQADSGRLRVTQPGGASVIFKDDVIYNVNPQDKTYMELDRATMKRMADQINPALKQMQEQLAKMPPEQRAQVEKMMGGRMAGLMNDAPPEIRKTDRAGKAAGHACTFVEVRQGDVLTDEFCIVPASSLKGSEDLLAAARKMSDLMQDMFSGLDAPGLKDMASRQPDYDKLGGIPVLTRHFSDGKPVHETVLQSIRKETLPAATFDTPAGYTKKDLPTL